MEAKIRFGKTMIACALLIGLAACTSSNYHFEDVTKTEVASPRFGDSHPINEWPGGAPFDFPVHGVDVSKYQGDINWPLLRKSGIEFAFIKATEGGDHIDDRFKENYEKARRSGLPASAYHFYYFCTPAKAQAEWFIANVPRTRHSMPHVIDMEWNHLSPSCKHRPPPHVVRAEMEVFMQMIKRHYGKRPIIYTTVNFYAENLQGHFKDDMFWLRSVKAHPKTVYPGRDWVFWQYTATGRVLGIEGNTDLNVFAGTRLSWRKWLKQFYD